MDHGMTVFALVRLGGSWEDSLGPDKTTSAWNRSRIDRCRALCPLGRPQDDWAGPESTIGPSVDNETILEGHRLCG